MTPFLLILSAPSGGGKTTIAKALLAARDDLRYSISATTRPPRAGEMDGIDYHFLERDEFDRRADAGDFLEWAEYGGQRYGTLSADVDATLASGRHIVLDIDVQGARLIRERCQNVVSVFIIPPTAQTLVERLGGRQTEQREQLMQRLRRAVEELKDAPLYDYVVVNANLTQAVADVAAIIDAESCRLSRVDNLETVVHELTKGLENALESLTDTQEP